MEENSVEFDGWSSPAEFESFRASRGTGFIYKHSTRCSVSSHVQAEVTEFMKTHADVPVYLVPVVENRPTSRAIAEKLAIPHASPQAILLSEGEPVWNASHGDITAAALSEAWKTLSAAP